MGIGEPTMTRHTLRVLTLMLEDPRSELSGADLSKLTGLASGTIYPLLLRLEGAAWLESRWETDEPTAMGRPRKRLYRVTGLGVRKLKAEVREVRGMMGGPAWVL
jgi:PadR family transcriptional regulator PadR